MESGRANRVLGVEGFDNERAERDSGLCRKGTERNGGNFRAAAGNETGADACAERGAGFFPGCSGGGAGSGSFGYIGADLCAEYENEEVPQTFLQLSADSQPEGYVGEQGECYRTGI